ncbi:hypothetical protein [Helicobacter pylori]|uniref:hypothetical protein n=1 Tax=Helicobacter pylori TaxID=210 RepID=UPI0004283A08|nr:hypothetical protein [Helicobacter pylori]MBM0605240.1 hypothetical protein [Helicobacter pylori]MBM0613106.1 hypothetical protein [Helicobacter pylori]WQU32311.1 hypothetical protein KVE79_01750 [Helicobacter pylori]
MIGAIKTLRELETIGTLPNHYRDGTNCSVLNGNILLQTSLKHKNHNNQNWDTCLQNATIKSVFKQQTK